jgi:uncharacterized hydrophobic protein (TIGR00271 family)
LDTLNLEIFGRSEPMSALAGMLDETQGVSRVRLAGAARAGHSVVAATVVPESADAVLGELRGLGLPNSAITLTRAELVGSRVADKADASLVWADVIGTARLAARPVARYLVFMAAAGVIASYGVVDDSSILIVGAMAISPDLLPIAAIAVGLVGSRVGLSGHALLTLIVGMVVVSAVAAVCAFAQDVLGLIPSSFDLSMTGALGSLTTVNDETIAVAFAAGVAGMLALETRASSATGVAISVTTIPAAAYLGVAVGLGEAATALGALAVLGANVAMMVLGAVGTLALQNALRRRERTTGGA